jgi:trigger factor
MEQGLDPMQVNVDWKEFRDRQREASVETVKSTLVLDEIAKRESIAASDEDLDAEIAKFAERAGRTPAAVRARLEKEDALPRLLAGIRREKTMTWLLDKAQITT